MKIFKTSSVNSYNELGQSFKEVLSPQAIIKHNNLAIADLSALCPASMKILVQSIKSKQFIDNRPLRSDSGKFIFIFCHRFNIVAFLDELFEDMVFLLHGPLEGRFEILVYGENDRVMAQGTVKWFRERKGFGFITAEAGTDVFVHHVSIRGNGFKPLAEGDKASFDIEQGPKGPETINVVKL